MNKFEKLFMIVIIGAFILIPLITIIHFNSIRVEQDITKYSPNICGEAIRTTVFNNSEIVWISWIPITASDSLIKIELEKGTRIVKNLKNLK